MVVIRIAPRGREGLDAESSVPLNFFIVTNPGDNRAHIGTSITILNQIRLLR